MTLKKLRILEFIIIGLIFNSLDNIIAVKFAAGAELNLEILGRIFLFVLPFAVLSELIVDHPNFWKKVMKFLKIELKQVEEKIEEEIIYK